MIVASKIRCIENVGRIEHFDQEGGGSIQRVIYVEPYTAHPTVCTALKGTVMKDGDGPDYKRVPPHQDPIYDRYYCDDVKVVPMSPESISGMKTSGFNPAANDGDAAHNGQLTAARTALDNIDDFDGTNMFDPGLDPNLEIAQIQTGGVAPTSGGEPKGRCGAYITATYRPLIFAPGISGAGSAPYPEFDYIDPVMRPITKMTQMGRDLQFIAPVFGMPALSYAGGVTDTASIPEVLWELTCRRIMVPFVPDHTFSTLSNRINFDVFKFGNRNLPIGCVRMEAPDIIMKMAPDGAVYYDIAMKFTIRLLWEEYFRVVSDPAPPTNGNPTGFNTGYVSWNHQLGIPTLTGIAKWFGIQQAGMGYWPTGWIAGAFQLFGTFRGAYLYDRQIKNAVDAHGPPGLDLTGITLALDDAPFKAGMRPNQ